MEKIFEQQTLQCQEHEGNKIIYFKTNFQELDDNIFKCGQCALDDSSIEDYINIETIFNSKDDYIFSNWPPTSNQKLISELKQLLKNNVDPEQIIENRFKDLANEIHQVIDQKKKKILEVVSSLKVEKEYISIIYNQISSKNELKQILKQSDCFEIYNINLRDFLKNKNEEKQQNNLFLQLMIEKIKRYQDIPLIFNLDSIKQASLQQLNRLDDLIQEYNFFKEKINQMQNQLDVLIANKQTNDDQFDNFQKDLGLTSENQDFNFFKIYKSTDIQFSEENQIQLISGKQQFSNIEKSKNILVTQYLNQNVISIYKKKEESFGSFYFNYKLTKNKKYIVRFKFNDKGGEYILIGLINQNNLNGNLATSFQGKSFCFQSKSHGGDIVKGTYFYQVNKDFTVQMNIDIEKKQIQYLDFPLYQSNNQLNQEYLLDPDGTYYLQIQFGKQNHQDPFETVIDIIYFQEVENF
ncbi:hypothetical protein ABPG72_009584 [Tetrahymena utriculariae]